MQSGSHAVVIEAFGKGNLPRALLPAITDAIATGIHVVLVSRTGQGDCTLDSTLEDLGVINGRSLDGIKACTLLRVALAARRENDRGTLQRLFDRFAI